MKTVIARTISQSFPKLWLERELRHRPSHFEREFWLIPILCDTEKTSIDVGANMGSYSYYMSKHSKSVVLFEPNVDLWPHLRRLLGPKCELFGVALSAKSSTSILRLDCSNTGVATIEQKNDLSCVAQKSAVVNREVETRTLDSYDLADVSLIKIDVEGHEESVIEGAQDTISQNRPAFIIESENRHNFGAPRRLAQRMAGLDYLGFYLGESGLLDFAKLSDEDLNPGNLLLKEHPYVNNFIFVAKEQEAKVRRLQAFLTQRKS
jgi:FkbM family methyltransferase